MVVEEPMEYGPAAGSGVCRRTIVSRVRREVEAELARVQETARLVERDRIGFAGYLALLLAIAVNVYGFVRYGDRYMLMWVVASLYFYMFYWLLPLIYGVALALLHRKEAPNDGTALAPRTLLRSVREARLLRFKRRLIAVGWNVWFLGGVSMTAGYLFIFSIDILYAVLLGFVYRGLALLTVTVVIVQAAGIMLYYLMIFFLRPYSSEFSAWLTALMQGRKERRAQGRSSVGPTSMLAGVSFMLVVLLVLAMLFPDRTLDRVLPVGELRTVRFHLYLVLVLASQLVIMQVFHRWMSRSIAKPVLASSEQGLAREARALRLLARRRSPCRLRRIDRAVSLLAETRLYRVGAMRPIGLYTLFLLGSDFLVVLSLRDVRRMDPRLRLPGRKK